MPETTTTPAEQPDTFYPTLRSYVKRIGGLAIFCDRHGVAYRTAQRLYSGKKPCPPDLRDEVTAAIQADKAARATQ